MEDAIYIGKCPICKGYGMLEAVISEKNGNCSILCEECFTEWNNPEDALKNRNRYRDRSFKDRIRSASFDEVTKAGWNKYMVK